MKVEIQSKKWIKPATPTPPHLQKHKLSPIDKLVPPSLIETIFYFDNNNIKTEEVETRLVDMLEESLSKVVSLYYPFAGRYEEDDDCVVSCQDQGVGFVVAKVDRKLDKLVYDDEYDTRVLVSGRDSWNPLVMVQVNIFRCGGLGIGVSVPHKIGDMFTVSTFMDAWTTTCRLGTLDNVVSPSFGFSSLLPPPAPRRTDIHLPKPPPASSKCVIKRYIFTGEAIAKIRSSITTTEPAAYTRVQLVMALLTKSLTNIMEEPSKHNNPLVIAHPMNFRSRITQLAPIQENTCGNLITSVLATCGQLDNGLLAWELPQLANFIRNSIQNVASEMSQLKDWTELSAMVVQACLNFEDEIKKGDSVNLVIITSFCRFPLYEFDFGWGRPTLVTIPPLPHNIMCLMDSKSDIGGGIEVLACLKEQDMARFQQDQDIIKYASF